MLGILDRMKMKKGLEIAWAVFFFFFFLFLISPSDRMCTASYQVEEYFVWFSAVLNSVYFSLQLLSQDCYLHHPRSLQDLVHPR